MHADREKGLAIEIGEIVPLKVCVIPRRCKRIAVVR